MGISGQLLSDNQVLQITIENTTESWYMWTGLLITNDEIITAQVTDPSYECILDSTDIDFATSTYFYGPFDEGDFNDVVWGGTKIENLPPSETTDSPVTLETSQKAVIWTRITFESDSSGETIQIRIEI